TIAGPVLGALVLFGLQEALSSYGAWYLVIVGGLAVAATLIASRGLWGFAADRYGWSLLPVGYRVRPPRPPHPPRPGCPPRGWRRISRPGDEGQWDGADGTSCGEGG